MRSRSFLALALCAIVTACAPTTPAVGTADDEAAIKAMAPSYIDAWNKGDAKALSAMMSEDVHSLQLTGEHLSGRAAWEKATADGFAVRPAGQALAVNTSYLKWLDANTAATGGSWSVSGAPAGAPAKGNWSNVVVRNGTGWLIAVTQVSADFVLPAPMAADTAKVAK